MSSSVQRRDFSDFINRIDYCSRKDSVELMTEDFLTEIYKDLPKLGPGSPETTRRVYSTLRLPSEPTILDVGCGTGMTSIELARISHGRIFSLDINQAYLDILAERAVQQGVAERIQTVRGDMRSMDFEKGFFDAIWAESVIFSLGFETALKKWRRFLKSGGYLVVSLLVRLDNAAPAEAKGYWEEVYPSVMTQEEIQQAIERQRYRLVEKLKIPDSDAWKNCYRPLAKRVAVLRERYPCNNEMKAILDMNQREIDIFRKYGYEHYGFLIYTMQA